jgi:ribosomal protein S18 acetylase RimI-like enzyme
MGANATRRLRRAGPSDAATLIELQREFYVEDRLEHGAANVRALRQLLREPWAGLVWLIESGRDAASRRGGGGETGRGSDDRRAFAPAGYVVLTLGFSLERGGRDAFIDELYVRREHRRRGLGALAIATAEKGARRLGVRAVHLEVDAGNEAARRLYERVGFRLRGRYQLMTKALR